MKATLWLKVGKEGKEKDKEVKGCEMTNEKKRGEWERK